MRAIVQDEYGSADVLRLEEVDRSDIGDDEALVRVRAAGVDRGVWHVMAGTLIIVGDEGGRWLGGTDRQLRAQTLPPFVGQRLGTFISSENHEDIFALRPRRVQKITPVIDRTCPLSEAPEAIRYLEGGRTRGKIVIAV